ncbi:MAG: cytochrome-c peroxidase [Kofleriaceae bacterium]
MKTLLPLVLVVGGCNERGQTPDPFGVPISGGTMLVTSDGSRAVISDPDRDRILQVDLATQAVITELPLDTGDEPGRLIEDAAGRVHVALRRGNALLTMTAAGAIIDRRAACVEPRGLAFDAATDQIHIACGSGELVTFAASGGGAVRSLRLERDLRDVVVQGTNLLVTKFRTAEILTLDATGAVVTRTMPPTVPRFDFGGPIPGDGGSGAGIPESGQFDAPANTAYRTIAMPDGRIVMSHQRRVKRVLDSEQPGGYGGDCGGGPVEDGVTVIAPGQAPRAAGRIGNGALPVDIAASVAGDKIAVVTAGSRTVTVVPSTMLSTPDEDRCEPPEPTPCGEDGSGSGSGGTGGGSGGSGGSDDLPVPPPGSSMGGCCEDKDRDFRCDDDDDDDEDDDNSNERLGPPTSVAWTPSGDLLIFYPEAPAIIVRVAGGPMAHRITLPGRGHNDQGRNVFHAQTSLGVACASCHPEGREDGLVWDFASEGQRRTQSLAGSLLDRAPFHWDAKETTLAMLLDDVFAKRMSGGVLTAGQKASLGPWLDRIPAPQSLASDAAAVERGRAIFENGEVGCVACHSGPLLTNNQRADVGTGGAFKTPSLLGVGARAPFLHTGCATTMMDRFGRCNAGPGVHGDTSNLSSDQLNDLVQYLDSL